MSVGETQERQLLLTAVKQQPDDPVLLSALGYLEQKRGATMRPANCIGERLHLPPT
jgi:hypothetical protein